MVKGPSDALQGIDAILRVVENNLVRDEERLMSVGCPKAIEREASG